MKIAFIGCRDIHKLGGIENYMLNLCTKLAERGHTPILYCESDRDEEEVVNGFRVIHRVSPKCRFWIKPILGLKAIRQTLREHPDVDAFHFNGGSPGYFAWIARLHGKTTIYMGHGIEWRRAMYNKITGTVLKILTWYAAVICTKYPISVSKEQTRYIEKHYHKKSRTIPTAVNLPKREKVTTEIMDKYGLQEGKYLLSLGRLVPEKNPHYMVMAFNASRIKNLKLVIAGANEFDPNYVASLYELGKDNPNVIYTGAVYGDDKECLLSNCLAFVIPSTIEGLSITLLEAMSYGKAVIASDIEANIEGLDKNGIWVKAEDVETLKEAYLKVVNHELDLEKIGSWNKKHIAEKFTWDKITDLYEDFLSSVAGKRV